MGDSQGFTAARLIGLSRVDGVAVSPCGGWLALAVARLDADGAKYVRDLWRVAIDGSGEPAQLTRGASDDRAPGFRRDGALGFLSNRNPREGAAEEGDAKRAQVWILPAAGGEPHPLTDEPLGVESFRFAKAEDRLALVAGVLPGVAAEEQRSVADDRREHGPSALHYHFMPVRFWDHWFPDAAPHLIVCDESGGARQDLTPDATREHRNPEWDVSPDGRRIAITQESDGPDRVDDRALLVLDVETLERRVLGREELVQTAQPIFSPDGSALACRRHRRSKQACGRPELFVFDVTSGKGQSVAPDWDAFPALHAWSRDGRGLLATADERGAVPVFRVDVRTGARSAITAPKAGGVHEAVRYTPDGSAVVGLRHGILQPPEPFRVDAGTGSPVLLAHLSGITEAELRQVATWRAFETPGEDGVPVQSFVVLPRGHTRPLPGLIWIHGGPLGQWSDGWHWRWNALVPAAAGHAVVLPNPRGSTGFGQDFVEGIWRNRWGEACYTDVMSAAEAAATLPEVDGERMAAMGGSFGGYMTNWIGGNTDRFRALVSHASLFSFQAFRDVTDFPSFWQYYFGSDDPLANRDEYERYSPHRLVAHWKTPTLVIHGEKDYRVPVGEALALFENLQRHGVPSELLVFPDENHWILKPRNIQFWYDTFLRFLAQHLDAPA